LIATSFLKISSIYHRGVLYPSSTSTNLEAEQKDSLLPQTMKLINLLSSAVLAISTVSATPNCPGREVTPEEQLSIFKSFVHLFYVAKDIPTAFQTHVAESYIQHNPGFKSGRQIAQDGLSKFVPMVNFTVAKISLTDNTGWVLAKQVGPGKEGYNAVVDIFRMDGSCVVEHWDVIQARPANPVNPLALFDGQVLSSAV
jgi:predicted SnoaL-like aldol condensation-catalyzing enzyme